MSSEIYMTNMDNKNLKKGLSMRKGREFLGNIHLPMNLKSSSKSFLDLKMFMNICSLSEMVRADLIQSLALSMGICQRVQLSQIWLFQLTVVFVNCLMAVKKH